MPIRRRADRPQHLERDATIQRALLGFKDDPHAAATNLAHDAKVAKLFVARSSQPIQLAFRVSLGLRASAGSFDHRDRREDRSNRRRPGVFGHQRLEVLAFVELEDLRDRADILVRVDQLIAVRAERRHAGGKLPAILDVQQQPRNQPRRLFGPFLRSQIATTPVGKMINRRDAAFVMQFRHESSCHEWVEERKSTA